MEADCTQAQQYQMLYNMCVNKWILIFNMCLVRCSPLFLFKQVATKSVQINLMFSFLSQENQHIVKNHSKFDLYVIKSSNNKYI